MVRGKAREQAILAATIALIAEVGYEAMTMDAVATRAHASKTTIYRRWAGKPELVRAAVEAYLAARSRGVPDTGSLRGDLLEMLTSSREQMTEDFLALMGGLVQTMRQDAELRGALWTHLVDNVGAFGPIIRRAADRGEVAAGTGAELAHEVAEAQILRQMMLDRPVDDAFLRRLVDDLLLPLLTHRFPD
jgi:AcrR family transcriptional regulator